MLLRHKREIKKTITQQRMKRTAHNTQKNRENNSTFMNGLTWWTILNKNGNKLSKQYVLTFTTTHRGAKTREHNKYKVRAEIGENKIASGPNRKYINKQNKQRM